MGKHLQFSMGLSESPCDEPIRKTFLGQAHIAGTGPDGKTCRECAFWHEWKLSLHEEDWCSCNVGYEVLTSDDTVLTLKDAPCNKRILNKSDAKVPHYAPACMFFDPKECAQPAEFTSDETLWHPEPHKDGKFKVVFGPDAERVACGASGDRMAVFSFYSKAAQRAIALNLKEGLS